MKRNGTKWMVEEIQPFSFVNWGGLKVGFVSGAPGWWFLKNFFRFFKKHHPPPQPQEQLKHRIPLKTF